MDRRRVLVMALLIGLLVAQFVHSGAVAHVHDNSPSTAELATEYSGHIGEEVYRWARVIDVRRESVRVRSGPWSFRSPDAFHAWSRATRSRSTAG